MASQLSSRRCSLPLLLLFLLVSVASAQAASPSSRHAGASISHNVTLLGDASIQNGTISLTCARHHCTGVGRALYSNPVALRDHGTNRALSFSSNFTFSITPVDGVFGDGLAFLITSDSSHIGSSHGYMGIFYNEHPKKATSSGSHSTHPHQSARKLLETTTSSGGHHDHQKQRSRSRIKTVAVEFDTTHNNGDINGNHVALDVGSMSSVASADAEAAGVGLKTGYKMRAWVEYNGDSKELQVWLSYLRSRPPVPLLKTKIDLSRFLHDMMFVGFSASNGKGAALHVVEEWKFQTSPLTGKAASSSSSWWRRSWTALSLGAGIGLAVALVVMVTGCVVYRRRSRRRDGSKEIEAPVGDVPVLAHAV